MKLNYSKFLTLFCALIFCNLGRSQDSLEYGFIADAEKIYLQLDGNVYTNDNVIWFKCILANAADHTPTAASSVVYAELIDPLGKILETKVVKTVLGIGQGFFQLNQSYLEGKHLIRAYTEWSKNYGADFFFEGYIDIYDATEEVSRPAIDNIELQDRPGLGTHLKASFNPLSLDSLHEKDLTSYLWFDDRKDTLKIRRQKEHYPLSIDVPKGSRCATLQFETKNHRRYSKSILLEQGLDLQFFPESGVMVHGLPSKVAFKAVDYTGRGRQVAGQVLTKGDSVIADFESNHLGMGTFVIHWPDTSETYHARLIPQVDDGHFETYSLPPVAAKGNTLTVTSRDSIIDFIAASNYLSDESMTFLISCRGLPYFEVKGSLKDGVLRSSLPMNTLPEGILVVTMMRTPEKVLAERLFFNERQDLRIHIGIKTDKASYLQREETHLRVETTTGDDLAIPASVSLLVINKSQMGERQGLRENIRSHFLLSSDLKGQIESPGYYFDNDEVDKAADLDALLLTQGWRKYHYTESPTYMRFSAEPNLSVSGNVKEVRRSKNKKLELTLATFGTHQTFQTQMTDEQGRFQFELEDQIAQELPILIQGKDKRGKKNYEIVLDTKNAPRIEFNHLRSIGEADSTIRSFVGKNLQRKSIEEAQLFDGTTIDLDEVVVEAYRMTPLRREVNEKYGMPNEVIMGEHIQEKEADWSYGLYSVLKYNFPGQVEIARYPSGTFAHVIGGGVSSSLDINGDPEGWPEGISLLLVDGEPVGWPDYSRIPNIPPDEVASFELLRYVPYYAELYRQVFPETPIMDVPNVGSIIAIYTKSGNGIPRVERPDGIFRTAVSAFSPIREFYAPKYVESQETDWTKPDLRALVHWEPELISDFAGQLEIKFYNADILGEMQVVVEAISGTGQIGYKELIYDVRKPE